MREAARFSRERLVEVLRAGAETGTTLSALNKALGRPDRPALERELAEARAVNIGTAKSPCYVLPEFDRRIEKACETILARATPGEAVVFKAAALRKGLRKPWGDNAIAALVARRQLFLIQIGRSACYLHARSIAPLMSGPAAPVFQADSVREAYALLVRQGGFADVPIYQLAAQSKAPLDALKNWLREESRAGRALPTRGDWSLADTIARAAAIEVRGEPHLQVRLI